MFPKPLSGKHAIKIVDGLENDLSLAGVSLPDTFGQVGRANIDQAIHTGNDFIHDFRLLHHQTRDWQLRLNQKRQLSEPLWANVGTSSHGTGQPELMERRIIAYHAQK